MIRSRSAVIIILATVFVSRPSRAEERFDVIVAGGSTAAFATAIAAAEEGARTCLIEPTDWVGGQLTSSGVPAVDEAWHTIVDPKTKQVVIDVAKVARARENMTPSFRAMLDAIGPRGGAWVSDYCFEPQEFLDTLLSPMERRLKNLVVLRNTVIKKVESDPVSKRITSITAIQRIPKPGVPWNGYDRLPSQDLPDWYRPAPSSRFDKKKMTLSAREKDGRGTIFVDATEWGELLVLSKASYLQGVEFVDGGREGNDHCGQATVFGFVERINSAPTDEPAMPQGLSDLGFGDYTSKPDAWSLIWTYRRIKNVGEKPTVGDLSLQNWGYSRRRKQGGNDYPFGYILKSQAATATEIKDWQGGVDRDVMAAAETRALAWHGWFKEHAPKDIDPKQVTLALGVLGTGHGLSKLPYIRDTRRSVGIDGFLLKISDLTGYPQRSTGKPFRDRIALGAYPADVHHIVTCSYPAYVLQGYQTLPYFLPFRALTNESFSNLLVAGKTMAQSFMANSATRLHPVEWSSGTAAGVAAAYMARSKRTSAEVLEHMGELQSLVRRKTPIDWTMDGVVYPKANETEFP